MHEQFDLQDIRSNGITLRCAVAGEGPLVLLVHGWPESWYSWRHQIPALVEAGYKVVVPEMRGYGKTDAPEDVNSYDIKHLAADMVGVLDAVGAEQAHVAGHDWGSIVAAHCPLLHPDRFKSLILMSVPYGGRPAQSMMTGWKEQFDDNFFYILYHNEEGGVAAEFARRERLAQLRELIGAEGKTVTALRPVGVVKIGGERIDALAETGVPSGLIELEALRTSPLPRSSKARPSGLTPSGS